ncbi:tetratricopeptide repeat protein [Sulfuricaulis sp.]|uniref:TPR domain-containing protein n=1 Tax=Sulfuricaulis sp. TaxID=2003553 RepID=UPI003559DA80
MIWFAAIAVLIVIATVWYVARPLARPAMQDNGEHRDQLQQLRERLLVQLNELDIEEGDRNIDADVVNDERRRLEAELARTLRELETLGSAGKKTKKAKRESRRGWAIGLVALGVVLPLTSAGLYALGQRNTLAYLFNPEIPANASVPPMALEMVARLEKRLQEQPDDAAGWLRLGRAYGVMGRQEAAEAAYARAYKLMPDNPEVVAEYASFLYNMDPQNTGGPVFSLFSKLLKLDPQNQDAMWFLGLAAFQKGDYQQALGLWEQLLKALPADSKEAEHLRRIVSKTREKMGKT